MLVSPKEVLSLRASFAVPKKSCHSERSEESAVPSLSSIPTMHLRSFALAFGWRSACQRCDFTTTTPLGFRPLGYLLNSTISLPLANNTTLAIPINNPCSTTRSEEHTSELQSPCNLVCRLLLEKKKK